MVGMVSNSWENASRLTEVKLGQAVGSTQSHAVIHAGGNAGATVTAREGSRQGGVGGGADGNMAIGDGQAETGVVGTPATARQIDLRPGMQLVFADLGGMMHRITADETARQTQAAAGLHEQHRGVTTGAAAAGQGLRRRQRGTIGTADMVKVPVNVIGQVDRQSGAALIHLRCQTAGPGRHLSIDRREQAGLQSPLQLGGIAQGQLLQRRIGQDPVKWIAAAGLHHALHRDRQLLTRLVEPEHLRFPTLRLKHRRSTTRLNVEAEQVAQQTLAPVLTGSEPQEMGFQKNGAAIAVMELMVEMKQHRPVREAQPSA